MEHTPDTTRETVLAYLYKRYQDSSTERFSLSSITRALITSDERDVSRAVEFLTDEKYLKEVRTPTGRKRYKISTKGISFFQPSKFTNKSASSISFNNKGGIYVFGDNLGTIKQETAASLEEITELIKVIYETKYSEEKKRELIGDAETIRAQMTKPHPDKTILTKAWETLQSLTGIIEAAKLLKSLAETLKPYLP